MNVDSTHVLPFEVDKMVARKTSLSEPPIPVVRSQLKRALPMLASDIPMEEDCSECSNDHVQQSRNCTSVGATIEVIMTALRHHIQQLVEIWRYQASDLNSAARGEGKMKAHVLRPNLNTR